MTDTNLYAAGSSPAYTKPPKRRARWLGLPILLLFLFLGRSGITGILGLTVLGWYPESSVLLLAADLVIALLGVILLCAHVAAARNVLGIALLVGLVMVLDVVPFGIQGVRAPDVRDLYIYPPLQLVLTNTLLWGLSRWCWRR